MQVLLRQFANSNVCPDTEILLPLYIFKTNVLFLIVQ